MALIELRGAGPSDLMPSDSTARRLRTESEHDDYICIWTHTCIRYASRLASQLTLSRKESIIHGKQTLPMLQMSNIGMQMHSQKLNVLVKTWI